MNKTELKSKIKEIQDLYLIDDKPWIIGYSGGKDSTCVLQLIYVAIKNLSIEKRHKKIWVICGDTLVEIPTVVERIDKTLDNINESAKNDQMPMHAQKVYPEVNKSFFVNVEEDSFCINEDYEITGDNSERECLDSGTGNEWFPPKCNKTKYKKEI